MTITVKYQVPGQALTEASCFDDVPESATFVWYDFTSLQHQKTRFLGRILALINLKSMIQLMEHLGQNINHMIHINISYCIVLIRITMVTKR